MHRAAVSQPNAAAAAMSERHFYAGHLMFLRFPVQLPHRFDNVRLPETAAL